MAAIAARARSKRSRCGRREATVPMFVAEQLQSFGSVYSGHRLKRKRVCEKQAKAKAHRSTSRPERCA